MTDLEQTAAEQRLVEEDGVGDERRLGELDVRVATREWSAGLFL